MSPERWRQVESLYHAALEKEPGERRLFLTGVCTEDANLLHEVESLLEHSAISANRLDRPAWEGSRLGPYQILEKLGEGGMGEVWKARDTRLERLVAIKRSKAQFSEKFGREARSIAALNHPHICAIYDVGPDYLVIELVKGVQLKGPLPIQDALRYASQIAEALEAAHRVGIIHRDLKPANILVDKQGVKLLDFGLARRAAAVSGESQATVTELITAEGMIAGTPQYMAPEQIEGKEPDPRADIFAFGCVLYEMITGKRAFDGKTQASVMAAVLHADPPSVSTLQPLTSSALDRVVKTCLAKDPDERWQSARDLRHALLLTSESLATGGTQTVRRSWSRPATSLAVMFLAGVATWYLAVGRLRTPTTETDSIRFVVARLDGTVGANGAPLAVSPDGRTVAMVELSTTGKNHVWLHQFASGSTQRLDTTEGAGAGANANVTGVFWSPDGKSLAFYSEGKLKRVPISGGSAQIICEPCSGTGGTWSRAGVIMFGRSRGLQQVSSLGGTPAPVDAQANPAGVALYAPWFLPDGKHFLYLARSGEPGKSGIYLRRTGATDAKMLVTATGKGEFASGGYLLFLRRGTLLAQRLDLKSFQLQGEPVQIAEDVEEPYGFSVSGNGVLAYRSVHEQSQYQPFWYDRGGKRVPVGAEHGFSSVRLSPDQTLALFHRMVPSLPNGEFWVLDLERGALSRVMLDRSVAILADGPFTPDSRRIAFQASVAGGQPEFREVVISSGASSMLLEHPGTQAYPKDWSRDNRFFLYHKAGRDDTSLYRLPMSPKGDPELLHTMRGLADGFRFSPDSRWIAYTSNDSGRYEIYIAPLDSFSDRRQISPGGGVQPTWRADGKELYYLTPQGQLMAVDIHPGQNLQAGIPKLLFQTKAFGTYNQRVYSPESSGKKFLFIEPETRAAGSVNVILHWDAVLSGR